MIAFLAAVQPSIRNMGEAVQPAVGDFDGL
jgi:hypothetical protein